MNITFPLVMVLLMQDTPQRWERYGAFEEINHGTAYVLTAPHGTYDRFTAEIASEVCERLQWSGVIARGFKRGNIRLNVNRPTEGLRTERQTRAAVAVYEHYRELVFDIAAQRVELYVEVHGHKDAAGTNLIEVATHGFDAQQITALKQLLEQQWSAISDEQAPIKVEGLDPVRMRGTSTKAFGIMREMPHALMFEMPTERRRAKRDELVLFLSAALPRVVDEILTAPSSQPATPASMPTSLPATNRIEDAGDTSLALCAPDASEHVVVGDVDASDVIDSDVIDSTATVTVHGQMRSPSTASARGSQWPHGEAEPGSGAPSRLALDGARAACPREHLPATNDVSTEPPLLSLANIDASTPDLAVDSVLDAVADEDADR